LARSRRKIRDLMMTVILLGLMALGSAWLAKYNEVTLQGTHRIIDGDSLILDGREIRLYGVDAPEYRQSCTLNNGTQYPCGRQSREYLAGLAKSGTLTCRGSDEDKYQRLLAICFAGDLELNRQMVVDGWAVSYGSYISEEASASTEGKGVWQGGFESPRAWRENARDAHGSQWLSNLLPW